MSIMTVDIAPRQLGDPVYVSQGDIGRVINVHMYDGDDPYLPPAGVVPYIQGLKPSGLGFNVQGTIEDNICTFSTTDEMTDEVGDMVAEVRLIKTGMDVGTANFRYSVEERPRPDGTIDGTVETVVDLIADAVDEWFDNNPDRLPGGKVVTVSSSGAYRTVDDTYANILSAIASGRTVVVTDGGTTPYPYVGMMTQDGVPTLAFGVSATYNQTAVLSGYLIFDFDSNTRAIYVNQMTEFYSKSEIDSMIGDIETLLASI